MKLLFFSLMTILMMTDYPNYGQKITLEEVRKKYTQSVEDEKIASELLKELEENHGGEPILIGYRGATLAVMGKHAFRPDKKMSYLKSSQEVLSQAINMQPGNIELRFLRFAIQSNVPSFLGYNKNLPEDKISIINNADNATKYRVSGRYRNEIIDYVIASGKCTDEEINRLKKLKN